MKTLFRGLFFAILVGLVGFSPARAGVAGQIKDQANENVAVALQPIIIDHNNFIAQTFTPTVEKITSIEVYLQDRLAGASIALVITNFSTGSIVGQENHILTAGPVDAWETFSFDSPYAAVTPGVVYEITLSASDNQTRWGDTGNQYAGGEGQTIYSTDYLFREYGIPPTQSGTTPSGGTDTSSPSGSGPASTTSNSIVKPTNLAAAYSADSKAVVLTWKASTTTTIGGYNVYRTTTTGQDYKKIGNSTKSELTFSDVNIAAGTTYYYMVRAYKDTAESANSNEASAVVPADAAVANSKTPVVVDTAIPQAKYGMTTLTWALAGGAVLLLGILLLLILRRRRLAKGKVAPIERHE